MKFWGVEVEAGVKFTVTPAMGKLIHITEAAMGEVKDVKSAKKVCLRMNINDQSFVIGYLAARERPQVRLNLFLEKEFELSHGLKKGSIYFLGYSVEPSGDEPEEGGEDSSDDGDSEEEEPIAEIERHLSTIEKLPDELLHKFASHLEGKEIAIIAMLSKRFLRALGVNNDHVWRAACLRKLNMTDTSYEPPQQFSWFQLYRCNFSRDTHRTYFVSRGVENPPGDSRIIGGFILNSSSFMIAPHLFELAGDSAEETLDKLLELLIPTCQEGYDRRSTFSIKRMSSFRGDHDAGPIRKGLWIAEVIKDQRFVDVTLLVRIFDFEGMYFDRWESDANFVANMSLFRDDRDHVNSAANSAANMRMFRDDWEEDIVTPNGVAIKAIIDFPPRDEARFHAKSIFLGPVAYGLLVAMELRMDRF
ncbi:hypothetical protein OROMI_005921 [Orobanche minor]